MSKDKIRPFLNLPVKVVVHDRRTFIGILKLVDEKEHDDTTQTQNGIKYIIADDEDDLYQVLPLPTTAWKGTSKDISIQSALPQGLSDTFYGKDIASITCL
jgi:hypothetical protein